MKSYITLLLFYIIAFILCILGTLIGDNKLVQNWCLFFSGIFLVCIFFNIKFIINVIKTKIKGE